MTASCISNLAEMVGQRGRMAEAESLARESLLIRQKVRGCGGAMGGPQADRGRVGLGWRRRGICVALAGLLLASWILCDKTWHH